LPEGEPGKHLAETLPHYMVPTTFHWMQTLPLTANGKINKKALTAHAAELATTQPTTSGQDNTPQTPTQQRIAAAWATLLGVPAEQIGPRTDFFELGGTSLTSVKLAIALDRQVSLRDITQHPVLAELAELIDTRNQPNQEAMTAVMPSSR
ncbi:phosphopantetheine-binding protein, partial [Pseudonocardia eucalypti]|uniref:phosphopantetheine-binding protein n=1 Tax=Pseudonocardia eucalypti TaxID=648755 RepID=UPI0031F14F09